MKMQVSKLVSGLHIAENVNGLTQTPIVPKNTIVTNEIIKVLKAFQIKEVDVVDRQLKEKNDMQKNSKLSENENGRIKVGIKSKEIDFQSNYINAVKEYKKEFIRWQSGGNVEIGKIRRLLIPLYKQLEKHPVHILFLQNYLDEDADYIHYHSIAVGLIAGYLAKRMDMPRGECYQLTLAGALSDCGMAKVNPSIWQNTFITNEDRKEIKLHPINSHKMVQGIPSLNTNAKLAILQHQERLDGSGYPLQSKGKKIHQYSRIVSISDVYHALICNRVYKQKVSPFKAIEIMTREMFGKLDVTVLQTLTNCLMPLSINTYVKLTTNEWGKILFIDHRYPTKPIIQLLESHEVIHLKDNSDIKVVEIYQHI